MAKLAQEILDDDTDAESQTVVTSNKKSKSDDSPADQFGRHASAVKLAKMIQSQQKQSPK
jgi:hypothetical protein